MRTVAHYAPDGEITLIDGVPLEEVGMVLEVTDCIVCGAAPEGTVGGALENVRVEKGVIRGDAICGVCFALRDDLPEGMLDFIAGEE